MAFSWSDLSTLTPAQQTALTYFETLGKRESGPGGQSGAPNYTYSQTKAARALLVDIAQRGEPAMRGVRYALDYYRNQNQLAFEAANP